MTDQELEKAYMNMIENRKPDLWNRIEEEIDALEIRQAGAETETDRQNDMQAAIAAEQKNKSEIVAEQNIAQKASYTDSQGFEQATADEGRTKHAKHAKKEKKMNLL
mgnify:CR=1 FL=1